MTSSLILAALLPSGMEWLWVFLIMLVLFGGAKLPSLARGLGESIREFKKAARDMNEDNKSSSNEAKKTETTKTS